MANFNFLDENGLLYHVGKVKTELGKKVDIYQGTTNGGKFLGINTVTGNVEPQSVPDTGVRDVEVDTGEGFDSVVDNNGVAQIDLTGYQELLTTSQMAVVNANPFTTNEKNKLNSIEEDAQENIIEIIKKNGTPITPGIDKDVDISVPTKTSDLSNDSLVASVTAASNAVIVNNTDPRNPTIDIVPLQMPETFTSTETNQDIEEGPVGTTLEGLDLTVLTPAIPTTEPTVGDTVIFPNGVQAKITSINSASDEFDAVIINVPVTTTWPSIPGDPMGNSALASLFNAKQNSLTSPQLNAVNSGITATKVTKLDGIETGAQVNVIEQVSLNGINATITNKIAELEFDVMEEVTSADYGEENEDKFFTVGSNGEGITFIAITAITNSEIDNIWAS